MRRGIAFLAWVPCPVYLGLAHLATSLHVSSPPGEETVFALARRGG